MLHNAVSFIFFLIIQGSPPGAGPYYENHGFQPESLYPPQPPMAHRAYAGYPARYYPPAVPQYTPRVQTHTSTPVILMQPKPPSGTACTSSRTLFAFISSNGARVLGLPSPVARLPHRLWCQLSSARLVWLCIPLPSTSLCQSCGPGSRLLWAFGGLSAAKTFISH